MTTEELAATLRRAYESAPYGDKTLSVQMWAIKFAEELDGKVAGAVARQAQIGNWEATINDAKKLARHVILKPKTEVHEEVWRLLMAIRTAQSTTEAARTAHELMDMLCNVPGGVFIAPKPRS